MSELDLKISKANKDDIQKIIEIEKSLEVLRGETWSLSGYLAAIEDKNILVIKASLDDIVGFVVAYISDEVYLAKIGVEKYHQRRGIGRLLIDCIYNSTKAKMVLEVRSSNFLAQDFYKRLGFKVAGIRKSLYENPSEDGIVMTR